MPSVHKGKVCGKEKRSKQYEVQATMIARHIIKNTDNYDYEQSFELLTKSKSNKPLAQCKMSCETEGIYVKRTSRFGSAPLRKFYPYNDIERHYQYLQDPSILVLGCKETTKQVRYYDVFRIDQHKIPQICDQINTGRNCAVTTPSAVNDSHLLHSSHSSLPSECMTTVSNHIEEHDHLCDNKSEPGHMDNQSDLTRAWTTNERVSDTDFMLNNVRDDEHVTIFEQDHQQPPIIEQIISSNQQTAPNLDYFDTNSNRPSKKREQLKQQMLKLKDDRQFLKLSEFMDIDDLKYFDFRYVEPNPTNGTEFVNTGGTYMFVARHRCKHSHTNEQNSDNDEDDDDDNNDAENEHYSRCNGSENQSMGKLNQSNNTNNNAAYSKFIRVLL